MPNTIAWYPIRVTYGMVIPVKKYLDTKNIKNFVPLVRKTKIIKEKPVTKWEPAISNYIFVFSTRKQLIALKNELEERIPIRFLLNRSTGLPLKIPKKEMENFIQISSTLDEQLVYFKPGDLDLNKGDLVKITGGPFKGVEGKFLRFRGDRRVVVSIEGIMAVATTFIHPSLIVPIKKAE